MLFGAGAKPQFAIVSVKGGDNINSAMIRDLKGTMDRERAALATFRRKMRHFKLERAE